MVTNAAAALTALLRRLHHDQCGATTAEYIEITVVCMLGAAAALVPLGVYLLRVYDHFEFWTGLPLP